MSVTRVCWSILTCSLLVGCVDDGSDLEPAVATGATTGVVTPQPGDMRWARLVGSTGWDIARASVTDGGNVYVTGSFQGTVDFGCGPMTAGAGSDVFVVEYRLAGTCAWSRQAGGTGGHEGLAIARDGYGNIYVSGGFSGSMAFPGTPFATAAEYDGFIVKYTAGGDFLWAKQLPSTGAVYAKGIAATPTGEVIVAGGFGGTVQLGGAPLVADGEGDVFVARYSAIGKPMWARRFGGAGYEEATDVAVSPRNELYVVGSFEGTMPVGNAPLVSAGSFDGFLLRLSSIGTRLGSSRVGSTGDDAIAAIAIDSAGNYVVGGYFQGSIDLGAGAMASVGPYGSFVARYTGLGGLTWARAAGGDASWLFVTDVSISAAGEVYATGNMTGSATFGGATMTSDIGDAFVVRYSSTGRHVWSQQLGGEGPAGGESIAAGNAAVYVAGHATDTMEIGGQQLKGKGGFDAAVVALRP